MSSAPPLLAPAVVVAGPPNSGKTTLLHHLDQRLQYHSGQPLVYVVKGNPDGTGRYLLHAPQLREELKAQVKGRWTPTTTATLIAWIDECRQHLDLVLIDCGGRRTEGNHQLFQHATHSILVARPFEDPAEEAAQGLAAWREDCARAGLAPLAELVATGASWALFSPGPAAPPTKPSDPLEWLVERLRALALERARPGYWDLRKSRDWQPADLPALCRRIARRGPELRRRGRLALGGRAPVWAYAAAMHALLAHAPAASLAVFDPKAPGAWVEIPTRGPDPVAPLGSAPGEGWRGWLSLEWRRPACGPGATLELTLASPDRLLPREASQRLGELVLPGPPAGAGPWVVSGAVPIWLHLAVSAKLAALAGPRPLAVWDARSQKAIRVAGRARWRALPWPTPAATPPEASAKPPETPKTGGGLAESAQERK